MLRETQYRSIVKFIDHIQTHKKIIPLCKTLIAIMSKHNMIAPKEITSSKNMVTFIWERFSSGEIDKVVLKYSKNDINATYNINSKSYLYVLEDKEFEKGLVDLLGGSHYNVRI